MDIWQALEAIATKPFNEKETYRPRPSPSAGYVFMGCLTCGLSYDVAWWHRLVRGHWPEVKE
jgi:hypothetical protein